MKIPPCRCYLKLLLLFPKFNEPTMCLPSKRLPIICLTETWLTLSVKEPEVSLDSYTNFRSYLAVPWRGRGFALCIKPLLMPSGVVIDGNSPWGEMVMVKFEFHHVKSRWLLSTEALYKQNQRTILFCTFFELRHESTASASTWEAKMPPVSTGGHDHVLSSINFPTNYSLLLTKSNNTKP